MSLNGFVNKLQIKALDGLAKKSAFGKIYKKQKLIKALAKFLTAMPFCRSDCALQTIQERLGISYTEAKKLRNKFFETFLINAMEMAGLKYLSDEELIGRIKCTGLNNLTEALALGKGAIIVSGHFGVWEFIPKYLSLHGHQVTTVVRRQNNQYVDAWFEEMRQRHKAKTTDSGYGMRPILRALKNGEILALMMDQDNGKAGIFVEFFGKWASAPTGPAVISLKTGAPIVPLAIFPKRKEKHEIIIDKPLFPEDYEKSLKGQLELTKAYTEIFEGIIRKEPHQWFWVHRRWKTQPEDAPDNAWVKELKALGQIKS